MAESDSAPKIISRKEAKELGLKYYFTGKPCKRGHCGPRRVLSPACMECARLDRSASYAANPEAGRLRAAAWRAANPEKSRAALRRQYWKNKDRRAAYRKKYYEENIESLRRESRERVKAYRRANHTLVLAQERARRLANPTQRRRWAKEWALANPEKTKRWAKQSKHKRRAREKDVSGTFTASDLMALFEKQKGVCVYCQGQLTNNYHVDHMTPISRGGTNDPSNLQLLCPLCNLRKGTKTHTEYVLLMGMNIQCR